MAVHPCPRCGRLIPVGVQYCDTCRPTVEAELEAYRLEKIRHRDAAYNRKRDPKYLQFYRSKDWRTLSQAYLQAARYKCEAHACPGCTGLAVEVHHKQPIQTPEGWARRLDWDNLEAVCTQCHNARHPEKGKSHTPAGVIDLKSLQL